ncbi:MAG: nucleoside triphosphate pyrophosphohydrolase [Candidatus Nanopelagicales bacterium]
MTAQGATYDTVILDEDDMWEALNLKLVEESRELHEADGADRIEEMADVYEVLLALIEVEGASLDEVVQTATAKRQSRGGFEQRIWMSNYRTP